MMTKNQVVIRLVVAFVFALTLSQPALAQSPEDGVRESQPTSVGGTVGFMMPFDGKPGVFPGVRWTENLAEGVALTAQFNTFVIMNQLLVGANWYFYGNDFSLYACGHVGAHLVLGGSVNIGVVADAGVGLEYVSGGFVLNFEIGPSFLAHDTGKSTFGVNSTLLLGSRF